MTAKKQFRQGDLLFVEVTEVPTSARRLPHTIVAEGELSGHLHEVIGEGVALYEDGDVKFLQVLDKASVIHPEHGTTFLNHGVYQVIRQREYDLAQIRYVQD
jgi:hypothetical protein